MMPAIGFAADDGIEFFEKQVRPILIERCYECHSQEKKIKGGLRLDTKAGWEQGGDSGPAIVPGNPDASLAIKAIRYTDHDLQMPPKTKLSDTEIETLTQWVKRGAPDPRVQAGGTASGKAGMTVEEGRNFWAFKPAAKPAAPTVKDKSWPQTDLDRFILSKLEERKMRPAPAADRATLIRRAYFDLIGLPPTPEQVDAFVKDKRKDAFERVVDELLASPHFGERWGRHWLDVARFAESSGGGRTLLFKDAWRFRDYVIEAFNNDMPFAQFVREQIAGDLLPHRDAAERRRQLIATGFLALGPTNYEEQDKGMLRMDIVDEQLDVIGKGFLGMTIACARCHDHKFDPIPTRDYYAMAGILRSTRTLFNYTDNVARWIDTPLPLDPEAERVMQEHEQKISALNKQIAEAKAREKKASGTVAKATDMMVGMPIAAESLPGVVVDDSRAKVVGDWKKSQFSKSYIGDGYLHDQKTGKGEKTLTFMPPVAKTGRYEVRLAYITGGDRADNVPVTIFHADGEETVRVNQRDTPPIGGRFISLGQYRFEANGEGYVLISNEGTSGFVVVDAVQFIPVQELAKAQSGAANEVAQKAAAEVKRMEAELKQLREQGPDRPQAMSVRDDDTISDTQIHIRGSIRNLGQTVPRGFLSVAMQGPQALLPTAQSGRKELADWIASPENPLAARVYVNRVWAWLFGAGLVRTTENFGTTGEAPSHPELLDYLALRFIEEGGSSKRLIREIMLSRAYQLASISDGKKAWAQSSAADPENRLFWRQNRRRMEAEQLRDTILAISGALNLSQRGGLTIAGAGKIDANSTEAQSIEYGYQFTDTLRSVYTPAFRNKRLELFEVFDFGDINAPVGVRNASTVAPQALFLMNHPFVLEQAEVAASRALASGSRTESALVDLAYRTALGRLPTPRERDLAMRFLDCKENERQDAEARQKTLAQFYQTLFASADFRHIN